MAAVTPVDTSPAGTLRHAANVTVYASQGGDRYHRARDCNAFHVAHWLWRWDPDQWVPGMPLVYLSSGYPLQPTTALDALGEGKTPCAVCLPGVGAALARSSCEEDFGHEPFEYWGEVDCRRCRTHHLDGDGDPYTIPVNWPCTTALILGLVDREVAS